MASYGLDIVFLVVRGDIAPGQFAQTPELNYLKELVEKYWTPATVWSSANLISIVQYVAPQRVPIKLPMYNEILSCIKHRSLVVCNPFMSGRINFEPMLEYQLNLFNLQRKTNPWQIQPIEIESGILGPEEGSGYM